jgi:hypothetical protein
VSYGSLDSSTQSEQRLVKSNDAQGSRAIPSKACIAIRQQCCFRFQKIITAKFSLFALAEMPRFKSRNLFKKTF